MITATISEAKNRLSALIDRVRRGETVLILDRQSPVAALCPAPMAGERHAASLQRLAREGLVRLPSHKPDKKLLEMPLPRARPGASVVDALLQERRDGR